MTVYMDKASYTAMKQRDAAMQADNLLEDFKAAITPTTADISNPTQYAGSPSLTLDDIYAIAKAQGLSDEGARAAVAIAQTEGGLTGAAGDNGMSFGPFQFYGGGGQLNNFAQAKGFASWQEAGEYVRQNPAEAAVWALRPGGYLGDTIRKAESQGILGADLATHAQRYGQVSVTPERAGQNYQALYGGGAGPSGVGAMASGVGDFLGGVGRSIEQGVTSIGTGVGEATHGLGDFASDPMGYFKSLISGPQEAQAQPETDISNFAADPLGYFRGLIEEGGNQPAEQPADPLYSQGEGAILGEDYQPAKPQEGGNVLSDIAETANRFTPARAFEGAVQPLAEGAVEMFGGEVLTLADPERRAKAIEELRGKIPPEQMEQIRQQWFEAGKPIVKGAPMSEQPWQREKRPPTDDEILDQLVRSNVQGGIPREAVFTANPMESVVGKGAAAARRAAQPSGNITRPDAGKAVDETQYHIQPESSVVPPGTAHARRLGYGNEESEWAQDVINRTNEKHGREMATSIPIEETIASAEKNMGLHPELARAAREMPDGEIAQTVKILDIGWRRAANEAEGAAAALENAHKLGDEALELELARQARAANEMMELSLVAQRKYSSEVARGLRAMQGVVQEKIITSQATTAVQVDNILQNAAKEIEKAQRGNGQVGKDTLEKMSKAVKAKEALEKSLEEAQQSGATPIGNAVRKAAQKAAPDPELREFLDELYKQGAASARHDEAAVLKHQKRMDDLMDGFLEKARQARKEAPVASEPMSPEDFDAAVMRGIQQRVQSIADGEVPKAPNIEKKAVREMVDKAFGNAFNTPKQQRLAAKASIQIEKRINKTLREIEAELKDAEFKAVGDMAKARVRELKAQMKVGTQDARWVDAANALVNELTHMQGGKGRKLARQLEKDVAEAAALRRSDIKKEAADMEKAAIRSTAQRNVDAIKKFIDSGGDMKLAAQALDATRLLGTEAKAVAKQFRATFARQKAMRAVGGEEWKKLTPEKRDDLLAALARTNYWDDPRAYGRFAESLSKPSNWERIHVYRIWSMLSGPPSMVLNALGTVPEMAFAIPSRYAEGTQVGGRELGMRLAREELAGWWQGAPAALREAASTMETGISARPIKDVGRVSAEAIPIGARESNTRKWLNMPLRSMSAADDLWRTMNMSGALRAEAALEAFRTGKSADDILLDLVNHPDVVKRADEMARKRVFQQDPGSFQKGIQQMRSQSKVAQTIIPFFNTIWNIARTGAERTPYGYGRAAYLAKKGEKVAANKALAEANVGSMMLIPMGIAAWNGGITGYGPLDEKERKDWLDQGNQPYSIKLGDRWVSYSNAGTLMVPLAALASGIEAMKYGQKTANPEEAAMKAVHSFSNLFMNVSALRGMADVINAMTEPERYFERAVSALAASFVPASGLQATAARALDPEIKDVRSIGDTLMSRTPGLSQNVPPQLTQLGKVRERGTTGPEALLPFRTSQVQSNPIYDEYAGLRAAGQDVGIGHVGREISNVKLTPAQAKEYDQLAGELTEMAMRAEMSKPEYGYLPASVQATRLQKARDRARADARNIIEQSLGMDFQIEKALSSVRR